MGASLVRSFLAAVCVLVFAPALPAQAAAPTLQGQINGLELAPQSLVGAAVFIFEYRGLVNGRSRRGLGWIAVVHEDLPTVEGNSSLILRGEGEIYIGLQRFDVEVNGGMLTLTDDHDTAAFDDDFEVLLNVDICNFSGQCTEHTFDGTLSHLPRIPTIKGPLTPAP